MVLLRGSLGFIGGGGDIDISEKVQRRATKKCY